MPAITVFGSGDAAPDSKEYQSAENFSRILVKEGIEIVSGGYGGIMEAVSKTAFDKGLSKGIIVKDFPGREPNKYLNSVVETNDYIERLGRLISEGDSYAVFGGAAGTAAEIATILALSEKQLLSGKLLIFIERRWKRFVRLIVRDRKNWMRYAVSEGQAAALLIEYLKRK
jgi:uncharacterized protein (TIGR00725 family)